MHNLENLAYLELPGASRDLTAMQALAREIVEADSHRLAPFARMLRRDLDAAIAGKAQPWSEARTRFEARKLARLVPEETRVRTQEFGSASASLGDDEADPALTEEERKRQIILRIAIAAVAAVLWTGWIVSLQRSGPVAWDGGTGPAQTQNLVALYGPAVLALLATLIAINPPNHSSDRLTNAPDR